MASLGVLLLTHLSLSRFVKPRWSKLYAWMPCFCFLCVGLLTLGTNSSHFWYCSSDTGAYPSNPAPWRGPRWVHSDIKPILVRCRRVYATIYHWARTSKSFWAFSILLIKGVQHIGEASNGVGVKLMQAPVLQPACDRIECLCKTPKDW